MYAIRNIALPALALCAALTSAPMYGWQEPTPADNTGQNQRDRAKTEPTADQGKNNAADLELAKQIRQALMKDKSLSTDAHNVKVIAQAGKVTLKGPVRSEAEKQTVEQKATEVAGAGNVTNEITIKAAKEKKGTN